MARSRLELHELLTGLSAPEPGMEFPDDDLYPGGHFWVYYQPPPLLETPCVLYKRDGSWSFNADNIKYLLLKRYMVTVIDRDPDSTIPDVVEGLAHCEFNRFYESSGLNHWVYNLYF